MNQQFIEKVLQTIKKFEQGLQKFKDAFCQGEFLEIQQVHDQLRSLFKTNFDIIGLNMHEDSEIQKLQKEIEKLKSIPNLKTENIIQGNLRKTFKDGSLSLNQSDLYETMPLQFTNVIPKTHFNLIQLIDFYQNNIQQKGKIFYGGSQGLYWKYLFSQQGIKCKYCFQKQGCQKKSDKHIGIYHQVQNKDKCPYMSIFQTLNCLIGCLFQANSKSELRMHLIIYHNTQELELWGINRQFLKFQEKIISFDQILQEKPTNLHQVQIKTDN